MLVRVKISWSIGGGWPSTLYDENLESETVGQAVDAACSLFRSAADIGAIVVTAEVIEAATWVLK